MQQDFWKILIVENDPLYTESISGAFSRKNFIVYSHLDFSKERITSLLVEGFFDLTLFNLSSSEDELLDLLIDYEVSLTPYYVLGGVGKYPLDKDALFKNRGIDVIEISSTLKGGSRVVFGSPKISFEELICVAKDSLLVEEVQEIYA